MSVQLVILDLICLVVLVIVGAIGALSLSLHLRKRPRLRGDIAPTPHGNHFVQ